jgi:hypothetical protein
MWWLYFDVGAERAARQLAQDKDPGRMARLAYTYFHIPIVAGIIVTAASDEMAVAHPGGPAGPAAMACLLGGPALYLFGNLIFKRTSNRYFPLSHMVGLGVLAAILPFAGRLSPLALSLAATATLVLVAGWEWASLRDTSGRCATDRLERDAAMVHSRRMADFASQREAMVARQIAGRGVTGAALLAAMREVPREVFVSDALAAQAYDDMPLPIEAGQTISQPYIVALMIEAAEIAPGDMCSRSAPARAMPRR